MILGLMEWEWKTWNCEICNKEMSFNDGYAIIMGKFGNNIPGKYVCRPCGKEFKEKELDNNVAHE